MKKFLTLTFVLSIFAICLIYNNEIITYLVEHFIELEKDTTELKNNQFAGKENYLYVQLTDNFEPKNKQDILNIYYTVLNSGMTEFTFYCPKEYKSCIEDVDYLSNNQVLLSNINNFVPVYNSFENIETEFDSFGKVTINIHHSYDESQIKELQDTITNIVQTNIQNDMTIENKIKTLHDYIINNTKYDVDRSDNKVTTYHSDIAYGALIEHYAICGGYADSMKLFLEYLKIPNYKISSENHIWNLVYLNNNWYHLDLTWNDPVTSTGEAVLEYDYFLISTEELKNMETDQHVFDTDVFQEAN